MVQLSRVISSQRYRTPRRGRGDSLIVFAVLAIVLLAQRVVRADIVIVRSSDAAPYKEADAALREHLASRGEPMHSVLAKELADGGLAAGVKPSDTVLAIGTPAARWLHAQLPAANRLVYCMVNNPADAGLLQGHPCWGVATDVAIGDQVKLIAEALPRARVVGMLYRSDTNAGKEAVKALSACASR